MGQTNRRRRKQPIPEAEQRDFVPVRELAVRHGLDRSHLLRRIKRLGFRPHLRRLPEAGFQLASCLMIDEARLLIAILERQGFFSVDVIVVERARRPS